MRAERMDKLRLALDAVTSPEPTPLQTYLKSFYDLLYDAKDNMTAREYETWQDIVLRKLAREEFDREVDSVISRRPW